MNFVTKIHYKCCDTFIFPLKTATILPWAKRNTVWCDYEDYIADYLKPENIFSHIVLYSDHLLHSLSIHWKSECLLYTDYQNYIDNIHISYAM